MHDTSNPRPDFRCLFETAATQHGLFTFPQAEACGYGSDLLSHQVHSGKFLRLHRGVYRIRDFPSSRHEEVVAAWLAVGKDLAVVSHESALELHGLGDVIPNSIHLTIPRSARYKTRIPSVTIHTTNRTLTQGEMATIEGIRTTSVERSIADSADSAIAPEQVEMAVSQALAQKMTTLFRLDEAASTRSRRVRDLMHPAPKRS